MAARKYTLYINELRPSRGQWNYKQIVFISIAAVASIDVRRIIYQVKREPAFLQDLIPMLNLGLCSLVANDSRNASFNQFFERFRIFLFRRAVLMLICSFLNRFFNININIIFNILRTNKMSSTSTFFEVSINHGIMMSMHAFVSESIRWIQFYLRMKHSCCCLCWCCLCCCCCCC